MSAGVSPARPTTFTMPSSTPCAWLAGVDDVLVKWIRFVAASNSTRSVKVPPTSTPSRTLMGGARARDRAPQIAAEARPGQGGDEQTKATATKDRQPPTEVRGGAPRRHRSEVCVSERAQEPTQAWAASASEMQAGIVCPGAQKDRTSGRGRDGYDRAMNDNRVPRSDAELARTVIANWEALASAITTGFDR